MSEDRKMLCAEERVTEQHQCQDAPPAPPTDEVKLPSWANGPSIVYFDRLFRVQRS